MVETCEEITGTFRLIVDKETIEEKYITKYYRVDGKLVRATQSGLGKDHQCEIYIGKDGFTHMKVKYVIQGSHQRICTEGKGSGSLSLERVIHTIHHELGQEGKDSDLRPRSLVYISKIFCTPFDGIGVDTSVSVTNNMDVAGYIENPSNKENLKDMVYELNGSTYFKGSVVKLFFQKGHQGQFFIFDEKFPIVTNEEPIIQNYPTTRTKVFEDHIHEEIKNLPKEEAIKMCRKYIDMEYEEKGHEEYTEDCDCLECTIDHGILTKAALP